MTGSTPNTPTRMPNVPTGPRATSKGSKSKVMRPMPKAGGTTMGKTPPSNKRSVSPKSQSQTVQGGPKK